MTGLSGRTGIVTGGTRGIGRAIVVDLTRRGVSVAFTYATRTDLARTLEDETAALGHRAVSYCVDSGDLGVVKAMVASVRERIGTINFLVNNAGVTRDKLLMTMSSEDWQSVLNVNLTGTFNFSRSVVVEMMKAKQGAIVNVSSVSGIRGAPGQCNYSASKAGIIGMTKALAREVARLGIRVNVVALGFIGTDMTARLPAKIHQEALAAIPRGQFGTPEEAAAAIAFLLSDEASYITGHVLNVDGGLGA